MITKIGLSCIASYKNTAALETDKKVNLVYGLNGTGKSTLSNFLYDKDDAAFSSCSIEGSDNKKFLVYNQKFIRDNFYESDTLKEIFTLSKENKKAEEKIKNAQNEISKLERENLGKIETQRKTNSELTQKQRDAENKVWDIKTTYTGGDRVLEFCLEGLKGSKGKLFNYISALSKPPQRPDKTSKTLKAEIEALQGENAQRYSLIPVINYTGHEIESNLLFQKEIIGNENSSVAELIKKFENSDWVKEGLNYLSKEISDNPDTCPFCQEKTITKTVVSNIKAYFDETYENGIVELEKLLSDYLMASNSIQSKEIYAHPFIIKNKVDFKNLYNQVLKVLDGNKTKIEEKLKTPSQTVILDNSSKAFENLNQFVNQINVKINEHNKKIDNKEETLKEIKETFWDIMRWEYDQTLFGYQRERKTIQKRLSDIKKEISDIEKKINAQKKIIITEQKNTVSIETSITNINNGLKNLGIEDFCIVKHSDTFYKIIRNDQTEDTFQTLSEGEKMIISFLYFCELCKGKESAIETDDKKIIVIDDPISSLSHIYIFNIGQVIKNEFFNSENYEQVFVLTHSLYFFYELTDTKHTRRKQNQKLFRIIKNSDGSQILNMKYEEIQNDYHSYWHIVKDNKQSPALIANCMRNIIEYFFNFIEKKDLNNVFQKARLKENKYQAFCRYINRESHSLGQNIFDYKEFNYNDFREALELVFKESGYKEHYKEMIK
ncbi:AAA family ATPase [Candidatus Magnetomoraceae bacterium gMMP-15]